MKTFSTTKISLLLNVLLLAVGGFYLSQVGINRTLAQLHPAERLDYGYYAREYFTPLPSTEVTLVGDSLIANGPWNEILTPEAANRGQSGIQTAEITGTLDSKLTGTEKIIYLWAGTNDVLAGKPVDEIQQDYSDLLSGIQQHSPQAQIVALSIPGTFATDDISRANEAIKGVADSHGVQWVDTSGTAGRHLLTDQIHVSGEGYVSLSAELKGYLPQS